MKKERTSRASKQRENNQYIQTHSPSGSNIVPIDLYNSNISAQQISKNSAVNLTTPKILLKFASKFNFGSKFEGIELELDDENNNDNLNKSVNTPATDDFHGIWSTVRPGGVFG